MNAQPQARLLIVDDEAAHMKALCQTLELEGFATTGVTSAVEALDALGEREYEVVLTDLMMPEMDGIAFLRAARERDPALVGIVMTGHGAIETAVQAMQAGALDYIQKPFRLSAVLPVLSRALAVRRIQSENMQLRESIALYELSTAVAKSFDCDSVLRKTVDTAFDHSEASDVCILAPAADHTALKVVAARGEHASHWSGILLPVTDEIKAWMASENEARSISDHPFTAFVRGVAVPMIAQNECIGVLALNTPRRLRSGQIKGLTILAGTAASALTAARLMQELKSVNEDLERRVQERTCELEEANRDLESFSYSVSHDLRAPLRAVQGFSEIYMSEFAATVPPDGLPVLKRISDGAAQMGRLIDDLLRFARSGRQALVKQPVSMQQLVARVAADLQLKEPERDIDLVIGELPDCACDAALIEQVLVNLLSNAFKFTRGRPRALIEAGSRIEHDKAVYFVRDNGAGFDMRYAGKLFGVFQRLHSTTEFDGTGVGLSIVQRIVQRHGGAVWAESQVNRGATFYFSIPLTEAARIRAASFL